MLRTRTAAVQALLQTPQALFESVSKAYGGHQSDEMTFNWSGIAYRVRELSKFQGRSDKKPALMYFENGDDRRKYFRASRHLHLLLSVPENTEDHEGMFEFGDALIKFSTSQELSDDCGGIRHYRLGADIRFDGKYDNHLPLLVTRDYWPVITELMDEFDRLLPQPEVLNQLYREEGVAA